MKTALPRFETLCLALFLSCLAAACGGSGDESDADVDGAADMPSDVADAAEDVAAEDDGGDAPADPSADQIYDDAGGDVADASPDEEEIELPPGGYEARGLWVTRWNYSSAADVENIISQMAESGFNQIYFQVRGRADAFYRSSLEPWASNLSGTLGQDPGWDPLGLAVEKAHEHGMQVHAWINSFTMWAGSDPPASSTPEHIYNAHPEWVCVDSGGDPMPLGSDYVFGTPGNPGMQDHIAAVAADIVEHYGVDGIHLDYVRYPGPGYSHDAVSDSRYAEAVAAEPGLSRGDWQRRQVNATVEKVFAAITSIRPEAVLSAAVWGIYQNTWGWSAVSKGYDDYFQDSRAWTAGEYIDALCPMIYWPITDTYGERTDFAALIDDHIEENPNRYVYAGIHGNYEGFAEIAAEIEHQRGSGGKGFVIFAYSYIDDRGYWDDLLGGPLALPAIPPVMDWK